MQVLRSRSVHPALAFLVWTFGAFLAVVTLYLVFYAGKYALRHMQPKPTLAQEAFRGGATISSHYPASQAEVTESLIGKVWKNGPITIILRTNATVEMTGMGQTELGEFSRVEWGVILVKFPSGQFKWKYEPFFDEVANVEKARVEIVSVEQEEAVKSAYESSERHGIPLASGVGVQKRVEVWERQRIVP